MTIRAKSLHRPARLSRRAWLIAIVLAAGLGSACERKQVGAPATTPAADDGGSVYVEEAPAESEPASKPPDTGRDAEPPAGGAAATGEAGDQPSGESRTSTRGPAWSLDDVMAESRLICRNAPAGDGSEWLFEPAGPTEQCLAVNVTLGWSGSHPPLVQLSGTAASFVLAAGGETYKARGAVVAPNRSLQTGPFQVESGKPSRLTLLFMVPEDIDGADLLFFQRAVEQLAWQGPPALEPASVTGVWHRTDRLAGPMRYADPLADGLAGPRGVVMSVTMRGEFLRVAYPSLDLVGMGSRPDPGATGSRITLSEGERPVRGVLRSASGDTMLLLHVPLEGGSFATFAYERRGW